MRHFIDGVRRGGIAPPDCLSVPHRAMTMLVPGVAPSLELLARVDAKHTAIGPRQLYLQVGRAGTLPLDLRLAAPLPFEDLRFNDEVAAAAAGACFVETVQMHFVVNRRAQLDGFYVYLRFQAAEGHPWVDSFEGSSHVHGQSTSWAVLFLPLETPKSVSADDVVFASCAVRGGDSLTPDYTFHLNGTDESAPLGELRRLSLSELYPLNGGSWCRACVGTTESIAEERNSWLSCRSCGDAYHRQCIHESRLGAMPQPRIRSANWTCQACR